VPLVELGEAKCAELFLARIVRMPVRVTRTSVGWRTRGEAADTLVQDAQNGARGDLDAGRDFLRDQHRQRVTGSTSLITVPAMIQLGIEPQIAVATNMLALTLMSMGSSYAFVGSDALDTHRLRTLILTTVAGSLIGALLMLAIPARAVSGIVSVLIVVVAVSTIFLRDVGSASPLSRPRHEAAGWLLTFVLGIYGGFFSGGYVTLLTAVFVSLFRMSFLQAIATTKVVNVFSSAIATAVFAMRGVVDFRLGLVLGGVMFVGGIVGARFATRMDRVWLRRVFVAAALALAARTLVQSVADGLAR
jgi:uncharacterized membrane protein YfcA